MRLERERKQAIRDGTAPVRPLLSIDTVLMFSPVVDEIVTIVVNQVISHPNVLKRRNPEKVVVVPATDVEKRVTNPETALPNQVAVVVSVTIVVRRDI